MKNVKENINGIILCLFEIVVGALLLINPIGFTSGIIVGAGIVLMFIGTNCVIKYFKLTPKEGAKSQLLLKGMLLLLSGGFCAFKSGWFVVTFPILTIVYGIVILVAGLSKVQWTVDALRLKKDKWFLPAISAVISLVCAGIVLSSPFTTTAVLWMFTGISLIVEAVFDVVVLVFSTHKFVRKPKKEKAPKEKKEKTSATEIVIEDAEEAKAEETVEPIKEETAEPVVKETVEEKTVVEEASEKEESNIEKTERETVTE